MTRGIMDLQAERAEALVALADLQLPPTERDRVAGPLRAALQAVRQPAVPGGDREQAARAEEKAAQAEADREEKRRPYEADPLFMYLWRQRYGTREYKASNLVRFFDRKVAHLIGFEAARINYAMLMELPDRLREHADRMKGSGPALTGPDAVQRLMQAQRSPAVLALLRTDADNPSPKAAAIRRRIAEIDAALAADHQPVVANE
jgi:hypothetical protein